MNPWDSRLYTAWELVARYGDAYGREKLKEHWALRMTPVTGSDPASGSCARPATPFTEDKLSAHLELSVGRVNGHASSVTGSTAATAVEEERRRAPWDDRVYTARELVARYGTSYSKAKLRELWETRMESVSNGAAPRGAESTILSRCGDEERRFNPWDNNMYTFRELLARYGSECSQTTLKRHWDTCMRPVPVAASPVAYHASPAHLASSAAHLASSPAHLASPQARLASSPDHVASSPAHFSAASPIAVTSPRAVATPPTLMSPKAPSLAGASPARASPGGQAIGPTPVWKSSGNKRIDKETKKLLEESPPLTTVRPDADNPRSFHVWIEGPEGTPYEKGFYELELFLPTNYPMHPPKCRFLTRIYHVNIDKLGRICLDLLKDQWSPALQINTLLISLQSLISAQNEEDPLDEHVALHFKEDPVGARKKAVEWNAKFAKPGAKPTFIPMTLEEIRSQHAEHYYGS